MALIKNKGEKEYHFPAVSVLFNELNELCLMLFITLGWNTDQKGLKMENSKTKEK